MAKIRSVQSGQAGQETQAGQKTGSAQASLSQIEWGLQPASSQLLLLAFRGYLGALSEPPFPACSTRWHRKR